MSVVHLFGLGVRTTLDLSGSRADELSRTILSAWSRCLEPRGEELNGRTLHASLDRPEENGRSEEGVLAGSNLMNLMQMLTQEVTHSNIATQTGRLLMLHAAAVCNPDTGASIALVAPGGTGKTTLARLLGAEYAYLTDETVGIREDGVILPYEKPLSIRHSPKSWEKEEVSPDALGLRRPVARPRLRSLALIRREPGCGRPKIVEMDVIDALVTLAPETSALSDLPKPLSLFAAHLDSVGPALHITYEEAESLLPTFRDLLGGAQVIRAAQPVDRLERDGRIVLLYERQVLELSPIADAAVQCAGDWTDLATLTERLVARFGRPDGDAQRHVESLVAELVSHGVMELRSDGLDSKPNEDDPPASTPPFVGGASPPPVRTNG